MIKMTKGKAPQVLKDNKKKWTKQYQETGNFSWHGKRKEIMDNLKKATKNHCAFCDDVLKPIGSERGQIEHFRPKAEYKHFAFAWNNLYPICSLCNNTKLERFDKLLLRPDEKDFDFFDWFELDLQTFELKPYKFGNSNWKRAEKTIKLYGFNKEEQIERRQEVYDEIQEGIYQNRKDKQPFRYM